MLSGLAGYIFGRNVEEEAKSEQSGKNQTNETFSDESHQNEESCDDEWILLDGGKMFSKSKAECKSENKLSNIATSSAGVQLHENEKHSRWLLNTALESRTRLLQP